MATSARELLALLPLHVDVEPTRNAAEAAITALGYAGRELHRIVDPCTSDPSEAGASVAQLATACQAAATQWPTRSGRLPDLVGAACDVIARADHELDSDGRWAIAVELATAARRCAELALRHQPYRRVPTLRWVHGAAVTVEQEAARLSPRPHSAAVLDLQVPAVDGEQVGAGAAVLNAVAALRQVLRRDLAIGTLPVAAALAVAAAGESAARRCIAVAPPGERGPHRGWRATPASWQVAQAALVRFEDGSRRRKAEPSPTVGAAFRLQQALDRLSADGESDDDLAAPLRRVATQLAPLARNLQTATAQWSARRTVFARACDLARREELVPAILTNRAVPAAAADLAPVMAALRITERMSAALDADLNGTAADRQTMGIGSHRLDSDLRWVARLTQRLDDLTAAASPRF